MTRPLTLIAVLALSACGTETGAVTITNVYVPFDVDAYLTTLTTKPTALATCVLPKLDSRLYSSATGSYEASTPQLEVATFLQANLSPGLPLTVEGTVLESANSDQPILTQKVLSYSNIKVVDSGGAPEVSPVRTQQIAQDMFAKFALGSSQPTLAIPGENLISDAPPNKGGMAEGLRGLALNAQGEVLTAKVLLEYRGKMSRSGAAISTGAIEFPIRMIGKGSSCAKRNTSTTSCPAPGQVGGPPACCDGYAVGSFPGC